MSRKKAQAGMFGQVVSGYVDPTPEGLDRSYQRHMDNLMMSESIRQQGAKLKAAPFEGDQQLRRDLLSSSDQALQSIASKGAYGNMSNFTSAVNRAATEFTKRAEPISQNQLAYTTYQSKVGELLEKGKIDAEDASGVLALSTMGYSGLSYDENGDATNFFSGRQVWQNPGLDDMINKALSNVSPDSWKQVRKIVGSGPDGSLVVETEQGEKYISPEKVQAALAGVSSDPAVLGYYTQKGQIRTAKKTDEEVAKSVSGLLEQQTKRDNPDTAEIARLQKILDGGKAEDMRNELIKYERDQLINTPIIAAISGKSSMEQVDSVKQSYDQKWLAGYKQNLKNMADATGNTAIEIREEGMVYNRIGGDNAADLAVKIEESDGKLEALYKDLENIDTMSEQGQIDLRQQIFDGERESRMMHNLFMDLYGEVPEDLIDTDEYRELQEQEKLGEAMETIGGMRGFTGTISAATYFSGVIKRMTARKGLRDFIRNMGLDSPMGGRTTVSTQYVDPTTVGGNSNIAKEVKGHFSAGFSDRMVVVHPDTGQDITLSELAEAKGWGDLGEFKYGNFGISKGAPLEMGPTMRIGFTDASGKSQSVIAPIGPQGANINIPSLDRYYYGPGGSIVNELLTYQNEGMESINDIPWVSPSGKTGYISADLTTSEGGTVTITDADKNFIRKIGLQDPELQALLNDGGVILR